MITIVDLKRLWVRLSGECLQRVFSDWETMIGFEATLGGEELHILPSASALTDVVPAQYVGIATQIQGLCEGPIFFLFPIDLVLEIIGDLLMIPAPARAEKAEKGLDESELEAFQEMANLLCGSSNMVLQGLKRDLRISQSVDHLVVWANHGSGAFLEERVPKDRVVFVRHEIQVGEKPLQLFLVVPFTLANTVTKSFLAPKNSAA